MIGTPTILFTHISVDLQLQELACVILVIKQQVRREAIVENPAIADWLLLLVSKIFLYTFLDVPDYWLHFEWQHRVSPYILSLTWLPNAPDAQQILSSGADPHSLWKLVKFLIIKIPDCYVIVYKHPYQRLSIIANLYRKPDKRTKL